MTFVHVRQMLIEAYEITDLLDGKSVTEEIEYQGQLTTPAMLLALAMNRCVHAAAEMDATRLTYFGFSET